MAIFKCKMCGGELEIVEGSTVCECEFCGTKQTIPSVKDENLQGLFNRANILRMKAEFDKAAEIYEKIIQASESEAEAYWGLILCKYGIEYVEDPTTFKRVPTCHRASFDAVVADEDYKKAIQYADAMQKTVYEEAAKAIDEIQKGIISLAQKEEPYDVFICYKETDSDGKRTQDSVIANDIYYQLTQEGFKVFYAAITLEDKLGQEYEPYIFSALNSAKVMLSLGTKAEYFNAVWVKNEWSRFLKIMKKDRSRMLIPCYRDIDAYELPEEFSHLQAQDMSKIGFINDLVRGIKKVVVKEQAVTVKETVVVNNNETSTAPLLRRAFMFLEDREWAKADEFCEQVLNLEPENAQAYVGKLLAETKVSKLEELPISSKPFNELSNYKKALRFAPDDLKQELEKAYTDYCNRVEEDRLNEIYNNANHQMILAKTEADFKNAAELFESIIDWKDAKVKAKLALERAEITRKDAIYADAKAMMESKQPAKILLAESRFEEILDWKDAAELKEQCPDLAENARKDDIYTKAVNRAKDDNSKAYKDAAKMLEDIAGWKDSKDKSDEFNKKAIELEKKELEEKETERRKKKRTTIVMVAVVLIIIGVFIGAVAKGVAKSNRIEQQRENEKTDLQNAEKIYFAVLDSLGYESCYYELTVNYSGRKIEFSENGLKVLPENVKQCILSYIDEIPNCKVQDGYFSFEVSSGANVRVYDANGQRVK